MRASLESTVTELTSIIDKHQDFYQSLSTIHTSFKKFIKEEETTRKQVYFIIFIFIYFKYNLYSIHTLHVSLNISDNIISLLYTVN